MTVKILDTVVSDCPQPGPLTGPMGESTPSVDNPEKHLLHQVLRICGVAHREPNVLMNFLAIFLKQSSGRFRRRLLPSDGTFLPPSVLFLLSH